MKENLPEAKSRYISRRNFALRIIGLSVVVGIVGYSFKNVIPNNYFTCELNAIRTYFDQRKINPKLAEIKYTLQHNSCINSDSK